MMDDSIEPDIEVAKLCDQPSCRQVADHCSKLLDAVVLFKSWFVQKQTDANGTGSFLVGPVHSAADMGDSSKQLIISHQPTNTVTAESSMDAVRLSRDLAVQHAKQKEHQLGRLRAICLAMRHQIEDGLRHKNEARQLRREVDLIKDTVSHYKSIVEEGNRMREDLRSELAVLRKEASVARSNLQARQPVVVLNSPAMPSKSVYSSSITDVPAVDVDSGMHLLPTNLLSVCSGPASSSPKTTVPLQDSVLMLRTQLERQTNWTDLLQAEKQELQQTIRMLSEKDLSQSRIVNTVRQKVEKSLDHIHALKMANPQEDRSSHCLSEAVHSVLTLDWFRDLAISLQLSCPDWLLNSSITTDSYRKSSTRNHLVQANCVTKDGVSEPRSRKRRKSDLKPMVYEKKLCRGKHTASMGSVPNANVDLDEVNDTKENGKSGAALLEEVLNELSASEEDTMVEFFSSDQSSDPELETPASPTLVLTTSPPPVRSDSSEFNVSKESSYMDHPVGFTVVTENVLNEHQEEEPQQKEKSIHHQDHHNLGPKTPPILPSSSSASSLPEHICISADPVLSQTSCISNDPVTTTNPMECQDSSETIIPDDDSLKISNQKLVQRQSFTSHIRSTDNTLRATSQNDHHFVKTTRACSAAVIGPDDMAIRVLTCPNRLTSSKTSSAAHSVDCSDEHMSTNLSFLFSSAYSTAWVSWFERFTSEEIQNEAKRPKIDNASPTFVSKSVNSKTQSETGSEHHASYDNTNRRRSLRIRKQCVNSEASPLLPSEAGMEGGSYLQSLLMSPSRSPSEECLQQIMHNNPSLTSICSTLFEMLSHSRWNASSIVETIESNFVSLCTRLNLVDSSSSILDWLRDHLHDFPNPLHCSLFVRSAFKLISVQHEQSPTKNQEKQSTCVKTSIVSLLRVLFMPHRSDRNYGLCLFPYVLDAAISGYEKFWVSIEPLRDSSASQLHRSFPDCNDYSFSHLIATFQALLAWQQSYSRLKQPKPSDHDTLVWSRLCERGWIVKSVILQGVAVPSSTVLKLDLSQQTHRIRCLALRLIRVCLGLEHESRITTESCTEAACALSLLLNAMGLVVGDEAVISREEDDGAGDGKSLNSRQQARRYRQTKRQQRQGVIGWLLTGHLLPWIVKCTRSLENAPGSEDNTVSLLNRLLLLTTDVIILGMNLFSGFHQQPRKHKKSHCVMIGDNNSLEQLRQLLFSSGGRLVHLLGSDCSLPAVQSAGSVQFTRLVCLIRLIGFDPKSVIRFVTDSAKNKHHESSSTSSASSSILWSTTESTASELAMQSISLLRGSNEFECSAEEIIDQYVSSCCSIFCFDQTSLVK